MDGLIDAFGAKQASYLEDLREVYSEVSPSLNLTLEVALREGR